MQLKDTMRYIVLGGLFLLPFIPLLVTGSTFFPFITGKNFLFRIIVEVMLIGWVALMLLDSSYRPRFSYILAAFGAFVGAILISDILSPNMFKSFWSNFERMEGWVTLIHLYLYFLMMVSVLQTEKLWIRFFNTSVVVATIVSFQGLRQLMPYLTGEAQGTRIDASFGNPTYLAIYAVFHIFIILFLMLRLWDKKWLRFVYPAIIVLQLVMLFYTATRGAILGFLGGIFLTAVLIALFEWKNKWLHRSAIAGVAFVLIVVAGFLAIKDTDFVREDPVLQRFGSMSLDSGTVGSRFMIWGMAWEGAKERPVFGWGQESFNFVFNKHFDPGMYHQEPWFDRTHNIVFDWLIAGGFVGVILYFSIAVAAVYYLWIYARPKSKEDDDEEPPKRTFMERLQDHPLSVTERSIWTGLLAAYFFHNLFVFDNLTSYLLYAAILAYVHVRVTEEQEPLFASLQVDKSTVKMIVLPVTAVLMVTFIYFANIRGLIVSANLVEGLRAMQALGVVQDQAQRDELVRRTMKLYQDSSDMNFIGAQESREQFLQTASRITRTQGISEELKSEFITESQLAMDQQLIRVPNDARTQLFMGSFLGNIGQHEASLTYLEAAHNASPNKQSIMLELGTRYLSLNETDVALEYFKQAFELAPRFNEVREYYALGLMTAGKFEEAEALFFDEEGNKIVDDPTGKYIFASTSDGMIPLLNDDRFLGVYERAGRYDRILPLLELRLENDPSNAQAYVSLAAGYVGAGNPDAAIEQINKAIEIDPRFKTQGEKFIEDIRSGKAGQ